MAKKYRLTEGQLQTIYNSLSVIKEDKALKPVKNAATKFIKKGLKEEDAITEDGEKLAPIKKAATKFIKK